MGLHGGHFRGEDTGGAVQRGEGLVEHGHVAADGGFTLDQVDVLAGVGERQGRVDAGDAAAHYQHVGINGDARLLERPLQHHAANGRAHQVASLFGGGLAVRVHPGVLLPDVDHGHVVRVEPAVGRGDAEGVLMQVRGAGGNDDAVEVVLLDVVADQVLAGVGAHVLVVAGDDHVDQAGGVLGDFLAVHDSGDVGAAVADVDADSNRSVALRHGRAPPGWPGTTCGPAPCLRWSDAGPEPWGCRPAPSRAPG